MFYLMPCTSASLCIGAMLRRWRCGWQTGCIPTVQALDPQPHSIAHHEAGHQAGDCGGQAAVHAIGLSTYASDRVIPYQEWKYRAPRGCPPGRQWRRAGCRPCRRSRSPRPPHAPPAGSARCAPARCRCRGPVRCRSCKWLRRRAQRSMHDNGRAPFCKGRAMSISTAAVGKADRSAPDGAQANMC